MSETSSQHCHHEPVADLDADDFQRNDEVECDDCGLGFVVKTDEFQGKQYFVPENAEVQYKGDIKRRLPPQTFIGSLSSVEALLLGVALGLILCMLLLFALSGGSIYADPCQGSEVCL